MKNTKASDTAHASGTIKCPKCGFDFELSEILTETIRQGLRKELETDVRKREEDLAAQMSSLRQRESAIDEEIGKRLETERKSIEADARKRAESDLGLELRAAQEELAENRLRLEEAQAKELDLRRREREVQSKASQLEVEAQRKIDEARVKIEQEVKAKQEALIAREREAARREVEESLTQQLEIAREELETRRAQLKQAQLLEADLRRREREVSDKQEALELEMQRRLDEARSKITEEARTKAAEQQQLKMREKDDLIRVLQAQMGDLQRRIEQGSQERQGEALECELIDLLRRGFPTDEFTEIKKGARGADIHQSVRNPLGRSCGSIIWESKNARDFSKGWVDKLKQDQQSAGAELAVLMTTALPDGIRNFGLHREIWVTDLASAASLCAALRSTLIAVERERVVSENQAGLKDVIYQYVTGQEFAQRVKMIAEAYRAMQTDLESEKRAMERIWKKRDRQIKTVLSNVTGMYGEIEGIVGTLKPLPSIGALALEAIAEEDDAD